MVDDACSGTHGGDAVGQYHRAPARLQYDAPLLSAALLPEEELLNLSDGSYQGTATLRFTCRPLAGIKPGGGCTAAGGGWDSATVGRAELAGGTVRSVRPAKGSPAGRAFHGELDLNPVIRHARVQFVCKGVLAEQWRARAKQCTPLARLMVAEQWSMLCLHGWLTPCYGGSARITLIFVIARPMIFGRVRSLARLKIKWPLTPVLTTAGIVLYPLVLSSESRTELPMLPFLRCPALLPW